jgi:hypothetical protein
VEAQEPAKVKLSSALSIVVQASMADVSVRRIVFVVSIVFVVMADNHSQL